MRNALFLCGCLFLAGCARQEPPPPKPVVNVKVARAEQAEVRRLVRAPATIFPREQANIAARITAPIRALRVRKGDSVAAGQLLAQLENRDLLAQREEAVAAVADAQANLEKISAGTLPADVERARGQVATTEAALAQAQKIYARRQQLFKEGAIPSRDLLVSQTELAQAKTNYEVARRSLELLESQSREKDIRIAQSRLEQAKARLALINTQLQFTELRSPFSGTITEQFLYPGDMAKPDAPVFTVVDLSITVARAQVPESDAASIHTKQPCGFIPVDSKEAQYDGRVSMVNKAVDPARRTVEVWCEIPQPKGGLRSGVFGTLSVLTGRIPNRIVIPQTAVQFVEGTRKGSVLVPDDKRIAHTREIEGGEVFDGKVEIKRGLNPGEMVITEGGYGLADGTQVRWTEEKKP